MDDVTNVVYNNMENMAMKHNELQSGINAFYYYIILTYLYKLLATKK